MPLDHTRPVAGASIPDPLAVVARCEGCELVVEADALGALVGDQLADCGECGSPVYVIDPDGDAFYAGFGAGWDACVAWCASGKELDELDELPDAVLAALRRRGTGS